MCACWVHFLKRNEKDSVWVTTIGPHCLHVAAGKKKFIQAQKKNFFCVRCNGISGDVPTLEARCSLKSAVWRRIEWVHRSANDKTTTWPAAAGSAWKSCFDQLGHDRSAVIIQRCAACPWISAIFPGGRHYFSPHKMAKKNHWLLWHSRFKKHPWGYFSHLWS